MAQDLKISELIPTVIDTSGSTIVDSIISTGKFIIPAYIPGEGNKGVDLGNMFNIFKLYIDQAAEQAVQNQIDQNNIGGNGSSSSGESVDLTQIQNQINEIRNDLYNPSNYPVTYIKLTDGTTDSIYQIATGIGQSSPYTETNPITIITSSVVPDNFYVTIGINTPVISGTTATVPVNLNIYSEFNNAVFAGGTIGSIRIIVNLTTQNGQYEALDTYTSLSSTVLNSSNKHAVLNENLALTVPSGTNVSLATVTCYISGVPLGDSGVYAGNTVILGTGRIKLSQS